MTNPRIIAAIDHGTTNSAIALLESDGPRIVQPNGVDDIMPSAVYINKRGRMLVGWPAYDAMFTGQTGEGTGHTRYKIRIGQDDQFVFDEANKQLTAQELGGIVISELLNAAYEETEQQIKTCLITVPAKFEQSACNGTIRAAQKAGLLYAPLLQEPIAAALAYGFNSEAERANWVVFDLGGGTLDISLVIVRNGQMKVPAEGYSGDNRLGGSKFDRELMDYVLNELGQEYSLAGFSDSNPKYRSAWGKLLLAIEKAKIVLSKRSDAVVEVDGTLCLDEKGKRVNVEVPINRKMYEAKIAPDMEKAVHQCENLIKANRLTNRDIDGIVMVGGPTKTPYVQQVLEERLGIQLFKDIDPMTAVAIGGAIHANSLEIPDDIKTQIYIPSDTTEDATISLEYESQSKLARYNVVGKVERNDNGVASELMVEIKRNDGRWTSGRIPVGDNGIFMTEIMLQSSKKPNLSQFTTTVVDMTGKTLTSVNEPEIWHPFPEGGAGRLANSLRVALKGNTTSILIQAGSELPCQGHDRVVTTKLLRKGSKEDILKIPVMESVTHLFGAEDGKADCNVHVGSLHIEGHDERIVSDIPVGSEIELTIKMDESRQLTAIAYIPLLDDEFESTFTDEPFGISIVDVEQRLAQDKERLQQIKKLHSKHSLEIVNQDLAVIEKQKVITNIEKDIARAHQDEGDACYRAWTRVLEFSGAINKIWQEQSIVRMQAQLNKVKKDANTNELAQIIEIENSIQDQNSYPDQPMLVKIENEIDELDIDVRKQPYYTFQLHVGALGGVQMPTSQYDIHLASFELLEDLHKKGAPEVLTSDDIEKIKKADDKLVSVSPNLNDHVERFLSELPTDSPISDSYGSDVAKG